MAIETIDRIIKGNGHVESIPQEQFNVQSTELHHAPKIFKDTCRIDWQQPVKRIYDFIRGLSPYPGAWTTLVAPDGKQTVLKIYKARKADESITGNRLHTDNRHLYAGGLELLEIQLTGKKRMKASDFINGFRNIEDYQMI